MCRSKMMRFIKNFGRETVGRPWPFKNKLSLKEIPRMVSAVPFLALYKKNLQFLPNPHET